MLSYFLNSVIITSFVFFCYILEPHIICPGDIFVVLKPGMNTSDVSDTWKRPWANVKNVTAVYPPGVSANYRFPPGNTIVRWVAVNAIGEQDDCVVHVNVYGKYINSTSAR